MSFDPTDLMKLPFCFGTCAKTTFDITAKSACFKNEEKLQAYVYKEGDLVTVHIPNIIREVKEGVVEGAMLKIEPFLTTEYLGTKPRVRFFGGFAKNIDRFHGVPMIVHTRIILDTDGTIIVHPFIELKRKEENGTETTNTELVFFSPDKDTTPIGPLAMSFSYILDDDHTYDEENLHLFRQDILFN